MLTRAPTGSGPLRTDGGGYPPPEVSKTKQRSEGRQTVLESPRESLSKVFQSFFAKVKNDVTSGHQKSNFMILRLRPTISDKRRLSSCTTRARTVRKQSLDGPFTDLSVICRQIWPQVNGSAFRGHEGQNGRFLIFCFSIIFFTPNT